MKLSLRPPLVLIGLLALAAATLLLSAPAFSYLPDFTTPGPQPDHWCYSNTQPQCTPFPVTWALSPSTFSAIGLDPTSVGNIVQGGFSVWTGAPNATLNVNRTADTTVTAEGTSPHNMNLICACTDVTDFTKDASTLAVTITTTANAVGQDNFHGGTTNYVGQIIKADIVFNSKPSTPWSLSSGQNFQVVATHEIGHFFGLDHSGVVRSVMFPAASDITALSYDDVAGLSLLYPKSTPDVPSGSIAGTVTTTGGGVVFGAHVYAESTTNAEPFSGFPNIRKSPISTLTRPDGTYTIQGVPPDSYIVTAEPLDGPVSNTDVSGYPKAFGQPNVQTNFTTRWH